MSKVLKLAVPVFAAMMATSAFAASAPSTTPTEPTVKIGVIDMQQILQQSQQAIDLNKSLQKQFQPRQEKLIAAQKNLETEMGQFDKNGPTMSSDARTKLQNKIMSDRGDFQKMVQSYQQDLSAAQGKAMQEFTASVQNAVNDVAKKNGYIMVVQKAAVPYADPGMDITKQVIADMPK